MHLVCYKCIFLRAKITIFTKEMSKDIRLKKGLNINLQGEADKVYASIPQSQNLVLNQQTFTL